jgi:type II secretory pathway pseudopilin PulG
MPVRRNSARLGYSLIELCLVIGILAIVLSLIMAGIQKVRAAGAQLQSKNNLRQMVLAAHSFQAQKKRLPSCQDVEEVIVDRPWQYSWICNSFFVAIMPQLDLSDAYDAYQANPASLDYLGMKIFTNPSDPSMDGDGFASGVAATSYAVNASALPQLYHRVETWNLATPPQHNDHRWGKMVRLESSFPDGTSNTVVLSEKYATCGWATYAYVIGSWFDQDSYAGPDAHRDGSPVIQVKPDYGGARSWGVCRYYDSIQTASPSGPQMALADGSVRLVSPTVSQVTLCRAFGPDDGVPNGSEW